jgi:hypothetical protein
MACPSKKKGYLLIIDNFRRKNSDQSKDVKDIIETFTELGFYPNYQENKSKEEIIEICKNISTDESLDNDYFLCIILAYTFDDELLAQMGDVRSEIEIEDIIDNFHSSVRFKDKKKLFFFQTFVSTQKMKATNYLESDASVDQDLKLLKNIKLERDLFFSFSRIYGNAVSISDIHASGTLFFRTLCAILRINKNKQMDICNILTKVNNEIYSTQKNKSREMSCFLSTLSGPLMLTADITNQVPTVIINSLI